MEKLKTPFILSISVSYQSRNYLVTGIYDRSQVHWSGKRSRPRGQFHLPGRDVLIPILNCTLFFAL